MALSMVPAITLLLALPLTGHSLLDETVGLFIVLLPALAANGAPKALTKRLFGCNTHSIDMGKTIWAPVFGEPKRRVPILGSHKTVEGFIIGVAAGVVVGLFIGVVEALMGNPPRLTLWAYIGFLDGLGAMVGDMVGSFIKRQVGLREGEDAPILDQLDFYLGALFFLALAGFEYSPRAAAVLAPFVLILHVLTNKLYSNLSGKPKSSSTEA